MPVVAPGTVADSGFGGSGGSNANNSGGDRSVSMTSRGSLKAIFGGERSYEDRRATSAAVAGDSKDLPDVIETWEEDQHYPLNEEDEDKASKKEEEDDDDGIKIVIHKPKEEEEGKAKSAKL